MVKHDNSIAKELVAKIINNSKDDIATNLKKLDEFITSNKKIVAEGEEILIKDADNKIIAKFENGKFIVQGAGKVGVIDDAIKSVAPYLDELKDVGVSVRKMSSAEAEALDLIKSSNTIKPEVNIAKAEVTVKNGQSYTSHSTSGYPDPKSGNILTNPPGSPNPTKGSSVFEQHTSNWEGRSRVNDTEVKLLEEFALKNGAKPNIANQIFNGVEGDLKLYTQLYPCGSCANVIKEFRKMFPKVDLEIITTTSKSFR